MEGAPIEQARKAIEACLGVLSELDDMLLRNRIQWTDVTTVAMVGGGARIPLIAARVSGHTKTPLVVSPVPAIDAAVGAANTSAISTSSSVGFWAFKGAWLMATT